MMANEGESNELLNSSNESSPTEEKISNEPEVTGVSDIVGDFGRWQKVVFSFFFICGIFSAWNGLALSFYAPDVKYWCEDNDPKVFDRNSSHSNDTCQRIDGSPCEKWVYDSSMYSNSIVSEWDLVCSRSWLVSMAKSSYMIGTLCAVLLSQVADKIGRFPIVFGGIILEVLAGTVSVIAPNMTVYLISRFFLAMGNAARWGSGFVIVLEIVGSRYRGDLGIAIEFGWALGYILLPIFAFFIRDFRLLQLTFTIPEVIFIYFCWKFVPESPRWQLTSGRLKEAERSLRKAAIMNGTTPSDIEPQLKSLMTKYKSEKETPRPNVNVFDLWKYPNLRKKTALLYLTWAVNGFVYYGLSFNTNSLEGNPYVNFLLSGAVEVPAYVLCMYVLTKTGRKTSVVGSMIGAGLCFLLILPFSFSGTNDFVWIKTTFAMAGKFFITCSFAIIYLYTCEVYPTIVRTVGLGSSSMAARLGAILAPFVKELGEATHVTVALAIFGLLSVINALALLKFGEETTGKDIPDTMEEGDKIPTPLQTPKKNILQNESQEDEIVKS